jgi:hypothetical protein
MLGADDDHQLVACDLLDGERGIIDGPLDETQICGPGPHGRRYLTGVADRQPNIDAWIRAPKCDEMAWQPIAGDGLTSVDAQGSSLQSGQLGEDQFSRVRARQNGARFNEEKRAGLGQLDAAAHAMEELDAVPRLKRSDSSAERRLSQIESVGGARNVLAFSDGDKNPELFERHGQVI